LTEPSFNVVMFRARSRFLELLEKKGLSGIDLLCMALGVFIAMQHRWS
jgi:hypothetical protein